MSEHVVIDYLRARGRVEPPPGFVRSVMGAIDEAPPARSWFSAILPAAAVAGAAAIIALTALLLGQNPNVGPGPSESAAPSPSATSATLQELEAAVSAATERLAEGAVEGRQTSHIEDYLASATWFVWRPSGDQVVIVREDIDVSAPWWADPGGEPLTVGERVDTRISMLVDGAMYRSEDGAWVTEEAPRGPLTYGIGMLSGQISPVIREDARDDVRVTRRDLDDGGELWRLEAPAGGTAYLEWRIGSDGVLGSYITDGARITVGGVDVAQDPDESYPAASTRSVIEFTPIQDPQPITPPDLDSVPDPTDLGLPADFPLAPSAISATVDELGEAVTDALEVLRSHEGVEGVETSYVLDEVGGASWFSWRSNGDQVVVTRSDLDVTESGWWRNADAEPPARGVRVVTQIQVTTGGGYYFSRGEIGSVDRWISGLRDGSPDVLGIPFPAALDGRVDPWQGAFVLTLEGDASVRSLSDGGEEWILTRQVRDGALVQTFGIGPDGALRSVSHELVGVEPTADDRPFTSAVVELTVLEDPRPILPPDTESRPDPGVFGMPDIALPAGSLLLIG